MKKLNRHSPDHVQQNLAKIREILPCCVTEASDEHGNYRYALDFDQLRQELGDGLVEGSGERYHLTWPGKKAAILAANVPIGKTLRPIREQSRDFDTTRNLFIEGDNLEALKLLQETYLGKVKMIYIDPPYNTGNDFLFRDDFRQRTADHLVKSGQIDDAGNRLVANTQANGRFHSDWLSMMYPRLKLAPNLLSDDGALFISIDDNESANLIKLGQEIFGDENFIAQIAVQVNPRGRHLDRFIARTHESIVIFVKDALNPRALHQLEKGDRMVAEYDREDENGRYRLLGLRNRNQAFNPVTRPNLYYPLYVDDQDGSVSPDKTDDYSEEVWPHAPDGVQTCWTWGGARVRERRHLLLAERVGDGFRIFRKDYLRRDDGQAAKTKSKSLWTEKEYSNDHGRESVKRLFGQPVMDFPKSPDLMARLVRMGSHSDSIILDFFSGSAAMAHGVMAVNAEDGGTRQFFMVQLPVPVPDESPAAKAGLSNIAEIGKERIRRAGQEVLGEQSNQDSGFRVLAVDTSNMYDVYRTTDETEQGSLIADVDIIKPGRGDPFDLLFEVLVHWGIDLTLPISCKTIQDRMVVFVGASPCELVACFDSGIEEEFVRELAAFEPLRAVFRDAGYASDAEKINAEQIFRQLSPGTDLRSL
ncbi:MAG: site-specific DNA-methyltransferase [Caldilineaceae bacterium]|nr:site-specific DNA-methyltransferase [Caldilineaceae bacterium]